MALAAPPSAGAERERPSETGDAARAIARTSGCGRGGCTSTRCGRWCSRPLRQPLPSPPTSSRTVSTSENSCARPDNLLGLVPAPRHDDHVAGAWRPRAPRRWRGAIELHEDIDAGSGCPRGWRLRSPRRLVARVVRGEHHAVCGPRSLPIGPRFARSRFPPAPNTTTACPGQRARGRERPGQRIGVCA